MSTQPRIKLTCEDFLLFPDEGKRHELIGGNHCVMPALTPKHQRISHRLSGA